MVTSTDRQRRFLVQDEGQDPTGTPCSTFRYTTPCACKRLCSLEQISEAAIASLEPGPSRVAHLSELREVIDRAIDQLPKRQALVLRAFFDPWPPFPPSFTGPIRSRLAEQLGTSVETVSTLKYRAMKNLREHLRESGFGPEEF
jgi:RNA polymerase sigma factor (sigma-70 family)